MADKRKPKYVLLLRKEGSKNSRKVELFTASLWTDHYILNDNLGRDHFRLRVNGKWWAAGEIKYFTKSQVKELFFRSMES